MSRSVADLYFHPCAYPPCDGPGEAIEGDDFFPYCSKRCAYHCDVRDRTVAAYMDALERLTPDALKAVWKAER